jgi:hypothetical protein
MLFFRLFHSSKNLFFLVKKTVSVTNGKNNKEVLYEHIKPTSLILGYFIQGQH